MDRLKSQGLGVKINSMGIIDKIKSKKKVQKRIDDRLRRIQVAMPVELHTEVGDILYEKGLSWQDVLLAAVESVRDEARKK